MITISGSPVTCVARGGDATIHFLDFLSRLLVVSANSWYFSVLSSWRPDNSLSIAVLKRTFAILRLRYTLRCLLWCLGRSQRLRCLLRSGLRLRSCVS